MDRAEVNRVPGSTRGGRLNILLVRAVSRASPSQRELWNSGVIFAGEDVHLQALRVVGNEFDSGRPSRVHLGTENETKKSDPEMKIMRRSTYSQSRHIAPRRQAEGQLYP